MRPPTLSLFTTSLLFATAYAGNTTYDDTAPNFSWLGHVTAVSGNCHGCSTKLDADATYNGTWHDQSQFLGATDTRGGSFVFTGTDVYLFGIHAYNMEPSIVWNLHPEGLTSRTYYDSTVNEKIYHALFYSATELANGEHTLSWELEPNPQTTGGNGLQVVLLDYAVVTAPGVDQGTEAGTQPQTTGSGGGEADAGPGNAAAATPARTGHSLTSSTIASVSVHSESQSATSVVLSAISDLASSSSSSANTKERPPPSSSTAPMSDSENQPHMRLGTVLGAILAALALLASVTAVLLCYLRRRRRKSSKSPPTSEGALDARMMEFREDPDLPMVLPSRTKLSEAEFGEAVTTERGETAPEPTSPVELVASPSNSTSESLGPNTEGQTQGLNQREQLLVTRVAELEAAIAHMGGPFGRRDGGDAIPPPPYWQSSLE